MSGTSRADCDARSVAHSSSQLAATALAGVSAALRARLTVVTAEGRMAARSARSAMASMLAAAVALTTAWLALHAALLLWLLTLDQVSPWAAALAVAALNAVLTYALVASAQRHWRGVDLPVTRALLADATAETHHESH